MGSRNQLIVCVVPGFDEALATGFANRAFNKLDFPTFDRPIETYVVDHDYMEIIARRVL